MALPAKHLFGSAGLPAARLIVTCALMAACSQPLAAEDVSLAEQIRARIGSPPLKEPKRIDAARGRLVSAVGKLNAYLTGQGRNGTNWKRYLKLSELQAAIHSDAKGPDRLLEDVLGRFRSDFAGLELPVCRKVAVALESYLHVAGEAARSITQEALDEHREKLAVSLEAVGEPPTPEQLAFIGEHLGWLSQRGQDTDLVEEIRTRLSHPNLFVRVSQELIGSGTLRRIDDPPRPLRDSILGTSVVGSGTTQGWARTRLVPDAERVRFETTVTATHRSQSVGYNGPARFANTTTTTLSGRKRFYFDPTGIHVWQAASDADSHAWIRGVWSNKRGLMDCLVRRVATRRAAQQKPAAEQVVARHAERQFNERIDAEANAQLGRAHASFLGYVRSPLLRLGQWPREVRMASTAHDLSITALHDSITAWHDGGTHLAAPLAPPDAPKHAAMTVQIHESLVNNYGDGLLAGRTLDEIEIDKLSQRLFGRRPKRLVADERKGPGTLTFARRAPVELRIDRGRASLTLRGRRFGSAERVVDTPLDITAHYRLVRVDNAAKAIREGEDIEVYPTGFQPGSGRRMSLRQSRDASFVRNRFNDFFTPEITSQGLVLPEQWAQAGRLELVELIAEKGWVTLAWRRAASQTSRHTPSSQQTK